MCWLLNLSAGDRRFDLTGVETGEDVLDSEPVGGRSRATELPCLGKCESYKCPLLMLSPLKGGIPHINVSVR